MAILDVIWGFCKVMQGGIDDRLQLPQTSTNMLNQTVPATFS
jgi:hypothetical protein